MVCNQVVFPSLVHKVRLVPQVQVVVLQVQLELKEQLAQQVMQPTLVPQVPLAQQVQRVQQEHKAFLVQQY
jgi:hypothetical protein